VADQVAVEECRLVDDLGAGPECCDRFGGRPVGFALVLRDLDHLAGQGELLLEFGEVRGLELVAALEEQLGVLVGLGFLRLQGRVAECCLVERGEMLTLVEVHEVGRGEQQG
jgi:hypothetical protein